MAFYNFMSPTKTNNNKIGNVESLGFETMSPFPGKSEMQTTYVLGARQRGKGNEVFHVKYCMRNLGLKGVEQRITLGQTY